jgi:hypothetical protein
VFVLSILIAFSYFKLVESKAVWSLICGHLNREAKAYYAELAAASLRLKEHGRLLALEKSDRAAAAAAAARSHLNVLARNVQGRGSTRLSWESSAYKASGITTGSQASKSWEELSFVSTSNRDGEKVTSGGEEQLMILLYILSLQFLLVP